MTSNRHAHRAGTVVLLAAAAVVAAIGVLITHLYFDPPAPAAQRLPAPAAKMEPAPTPVVQPAPTPVTPATPVAEPEPPDLLPGGLFG
jgi:hypothetical protein